MAADGILLSETAKKVAASGIGVNQKRPPVCASQGDRETSDNERLRRSFLDEKGCLRRKRPKLWWLDSGGTKPRLTAARANGS